MKDDIYTKKLHSVPDFRFDSEVTTVFNDMISRSVPGYSTTVAMSGLLAKRFSKPNTGLYDLGCSLGDTALAMAANAAEGCEVLGIDFSNDMVEAFRLRLAEMKKSNVEGSGAIDICQGDICDFAYDNASVIALNFTLQFIAIEKRSALLKRLADATLPGGALILSEKIAFQDASVNQLLSDLHHEFKRANGYSELEIAQKRDAIEDVLIPETADAHIQRLKAAGFRQVEKWFQCVNFASFIAIK